MKFGRQTLTVNTHIHWIIAICRLRKFLADLDTPTDTDGRFRFSTIKPGRVPAANGTLQAPHILVAIFARGLIKQLVTRIYFPGDDLAADQVMQQVPVERRATLIANVVKGQPGVLEWNIAIGGGVHETVFFEL